MDNANVEELHGFVQVSKTFIKDNDMNLTVIIEHLRSSNCNLMATMLSHYRDNMRSMLGGSNGAI